ncbi:MAG TPA: hypothetical protein VLD67_04260 [Vicinamibacterales bacterium]|nr:hypothetical protein [Vicinamibacterales bacterium]
MLEYQASDRFETLRAAHQRVGRRFVPTLMAQVEWPRTRLDRHRQDALRALLIAALRGSAFHRDRLAGLDPTRFRLEDLPSLPTMTKADLNGNFDAVAADPRITRERCEDHLASGRVYLDNRFVVMASGGTSGVRAIAVSEWEEFARGWASVMRGVMRWVTRTRAPHVPPALVRVLLRGALLIQRSPPPVAVIGASPGPHGSYFVGRIFGRGGADFSVADPLNEIVAGLNATMPRMLICYASFIPHLLEEARAGRLRIRPMLLVAVAEPFLPEHEQAVAETWECSVMSSYAATEVGPLGGGSGFDPGMLLNDDLAIVEPVDASGQPVSPGRQADKLFVTPLYQRALPVIRYELTDQLTVLDEPASCGSSFTRTSNVVGRLDDHFAYDGIAVHPHVFRTVLGRERAISEYQVAQTPHGAVIRIVALGHVDRSGLQQSLCEHLARLGLQEPDISVQQVASIERAKDSSKLKRFLPLSAAGL